ncbi:hypothetical protein [Alishewanella tabrizica]|uniref:Lipoprotein n=1 Tax=Alishewanella tabrizica TaxID=671278 RepID=A0ABQ2WTN1_9ALTE|nr:hypothetical protein [Alishewanella tabrizica]GGW71196.1 hypothetical protein GCM10008111_29140 [Alishewanella tabrizica]
MNLRIKPLRRLVLLLGLLVAVSGCQPRQKDITQAILLQTAEFILQISPGTIPVETALTLSLATQEPLVQVSAEIQGVSMYMGRIPLQWRQADTTAEAKNTAWTAEFFLGACSDPQMQWQLQLWLEYPDGRKVPYLVPFQSRWR